MELEPDRGQDLGQLLLLLGVTPALIPAFLGLLVVALLALAGGAIGR